MSNISLCVLSLRLQPSTYTCANGSLHHPRYRAPGHRQRCVGAGHHVRRRLRPRPPVTDDVYFTDPTNHVVRRHVHIPTGALQTFAGLAGTSGDAGSRASRNLLQRHQPLRRRHRERRGPSVVRKVICVGESTFERERESETFRQETEPVGRSTCRVP